MSRHGVVLALWAASCGRVSFDVVERQPIDAPAERPSDAAPMIDAPPVPDGALDDYCNVVPPLHAEPVIDGVLDPGLALHAFTLTGGEAVPGTIAMSYAVGYRANELYIFADITDPDRFPALGGDHPYCGDSISVYVDSDGEYPAAPAYDNPGARQFNVGAPANDTDAATYAETYQSGAYIGTWTSSRFGAFPRAGGYTVEAVVGAADLGLASWAPSGAVGIDLALDFSTTNGSGGEALGNACAHGSRRAGEDYLRVASSTTLCGDGGPYCDVRAFCSPALQ